MGPWYQASFGYLGIQWYLKVTQTTEHAHKRVRESSTQLTERKTVSKPDQVDLWVDLVEDRR
jgi:hypothetical protein